MTSEATSLNQSTRIDRFSSLPNELLDHIFNYAYELSPPRATLPLFVTTIIESPRLGQLIQMLTFPGTADRRLRELLPLLPNLVDLDLPALPVPLLSSAPRTLTHPTLSNLRRIAVSLDNAGVSKNIDKLSQLAALPSLRQLKIYRFNQTGMISYQPATTTLPQITQLTIEGVAADLETVKFVLNACPSVLHLELYSTYQDLAEFSSSLPHLPTTLHSLHLHSDASSATRFDHLLAPLAQLRSIRLGDRCYHSNIHTALLQLPLLAHIHLGSGPLDPVGFHSLVTGVNRLLSLHTITLDFNIPDEGKRSKRPSEIARGIDDEFARVDIDMRDWSFPAEWNGAPPNVGSYEALERLAKENGIVIEGNIRVALDWCRNYHLESNNRAVINAFTRQDLTSLRQIRSSAAQAGVTLPTIDFDSLDLDRLEIVEINLPEQSWWVLSLRNRE